MPRPTAEAAHAALGIPVHPLLARSLGLVEIAVGILALAHPIRPVAFVLAAMYAGFAIVALRLAAAAQACGCFGSATDAASPGQAVLSGVLAAVGLLAAVSPPLGLGTVVSRGPAVGLVVLVAVLSGAYGVVVAYRELPRAWVAWSPR